MTALVTSVWVFITSWFTPAVLFCFLNLMIGTIYITSNFKIQNKRQQNQSPEEDDVLQNHQLVRAPSLLQRVRSINLSLYRSDHPYPLQPETHQTFPHADGAPDQNRSHVEDDDLGPQLVRTPSLLQRLRSINFSLYGSDHPYPLQPESHQTFPHADGAPDQNQSHVEDDDLGPQLVRTPSLLQRLRSINFSLYRSEHPDPLQPATHHTDPPADDHHVTRSLSESTSETPAKVRVKMKKSASEKLVVPSLEDLENVERQRPATVRERETKGNEMASSGEDEEVDAKADDFINRFRQQLKLQRLDSLKEMFSRRSGK